MPQPPSLTPEQREQALAKAAEARRVRAELKEKLKMGALSLQALLDQAEADDHIGKPWKASYIVKRCNPGRHDTAS